ncbi:hypothetical protein WA026_010324 [Henosepilachna vigintioctopunctata]|uniref:Uncharacterized protein n=1 Tax=Henosepilachna vigintioctopunctata TaxID=420089 RepID=A0AAW1V6F4_9CUCU
MELGGTSFKSDLPILLLLYLQRGTNIQKAILKTREWRSQNERACCQIQDFKAWLQASKANRNNGSDCGFIPGCYCLVINCNYKVYKGPIPIEESAFKAFHSQDSSSLERHSVVSSFYSYD